MLNIPEQWKFILPLCKVSHSPILRPMPKHLPLIRVGPLKKFQEIYEKARSVDGVCLGEKQSNYGLILVWH